MGGTDDDEVDFGPASLAIQRGDRKAAAQHLRTLYLLHAHHEHVRQYVLQALRALMTGNVAARAWEFAHADVSELFQFLDRSLEEESRRLRQYQGEPFHVYFDMATITPEKAVLVIQSLSRMVGAPLEIISMRPIPPDPSRYRIQLGRKAVV